MTYTQSISDTLHIRDGNVGIGSTYPLAKLHVGQGGMYVATHVEIASTSQSVVPLQSSNVNIHVTEQGMLRSMEYDGTYHNLTPLKNKGDIIVHNGIAEQALSVGVDNCVLITDSAAPLGVRWSSDVSLGTTTTTNTTSDTSNVFDNLYADTIYTRLVIHTDDIYTASLTTQGGSSNSSNVNFNNKSLTDVATLEASNVITPLISGGQSGTIGFQGSTLSNIGDIYATKLATSMGFISTLSNVATLYASNASIDTIVDVDSITASNAAFQSVTASNIVYITEPLHLSITPTRVTNEVYTTIHNFIYQGATERVRIPKTAVMRSYLSTSCNSTEYLADNNFSYSARLMNVTNNNILGQITASNYVATNQVIDISDIPRANIDIELQIKKGLFGNYVVFDGLTFEYGP